MRVGTVVRGILLGLGAFAFLFPFYYMVIGSLQREPDQTVAGAFPHPANLTFANYDTIKRKMSYGDQFMRTWDFYLASVVAGFRSGHLNLVQMTMSNGLVDEYPLTREFPYERDRPRPVIGRIPTFPLRSRVEPS